MHIIIYTYLQTYEIDCYYLSDFHICQLCESLPYLEWQDQTCYLDDIEDFRTVINFCKINSIDVIAYSPTLSENE